MRLFLLSTFLLALCQISNGQSSFSDQTTLAQITAPAGGEGIAVGDFNNDGYDDFYVSFPENKNLLYKNQGDGTFVEVGEEAGVAQTAEIDTRTAVWGDIDNDGWLDLYVGNRIAPDQLFLNLGNERFEEIGEVAGIFQLGHPKSVNMADINADGFLDIYISNFVGENVMYLNNGDRTFTDFTLTSGALDRGRAMGNVFFDYDKDGDIDLYLVHDGNEPNFLYQNDGTGRFTEVGQSAGVATASFGMGVDVGDINNDGWQDIYITNLGPNFLLLNNGDGTFSDISTTAKVDDFGMGWGVSFLDYDNDGWLDIYVSNDSQFSSFVYPNILYRNNGDLTFERIEEQNEISRIDRSYGAACMDFDLDGHKDVLFVNKETSEGVRLLKSEATANAWLGLKLIGTENNRNGVGAKVSIKDELGNEYYKEVIAGQSWASQNSNLLNFGLGSVDSIQELKVVWPSGTEDLYNVQNLNQFYTLIEGGALKNDIVYPEIVSSTPEIFKRTAHFELFPNPSDGNFNLTLKEAINAPFLIEIYDMAGKLLFRKEAPPTSPTLSIELSPELTGSAKGLWIRLFNEQFSASQYLSIH
ncbi:MAG: FG-GAP-like repeat-containing protein [Bacteroidota bacterium]